MYSQNGFSRLEGLENHVVLYNSIQANFLNFQSFSLYLYSRKQKTVYDNVLYIYRKARLPNAQMLNIWLNINTFHIKNNCSMKKIKNREMSCNNLWIPAFVVKI